MKTITAAILIISAVFIQGCIDEPPYLKQPVSDVEKTNVVRREFGIREVKQDWEFYLHQFNTDTWKSGDYECKTVTLHNEKLDEILWEADIYHTGVTWTDYDGTGWEYMTIVYNYSDKTFYLNIVSQRPAVNVLIEGLECVTWGKPGQAGHKAESNEKTLEIADKILSALGLTRL